MYASPAHLASLSDKARERLDDWLAEFNDNWTADALATYCELLPADGQLRSAGLIELVKVDLRRRWELAPNPFLEEYLEQFPELGTADSIPADLLLTEYNVRRQYMDGVKVTDYVERFPDRFDEFLSLVEAQAAQGPGAQPGGQTTQSIQPAGPSPAAPARLTAGAPAKRVEAIQPAAPKPPPVLPPEPTEASRTTGGPVKSAKTIKRIEAVQTVAPTSPPAKPALSPEPAKAARPGQRARLTTWQRAACAGLAALLLGGIAWAIWKQRGSQGSADTGGARQAELQADDPVTSLTLKLEVGPNGDPLVERLALDLGLGFPFWLAPIGVQPGEKVPFGAVPSESSAKAKVQPGETVTFRFEANSALGKDTLGRNSQLLADVLASDIRQVGFISRGSNDWELAGYELLVNDQPFASSKVGRKARQSQEQVQKELARLGLERAPLERQRAGLADLLKIQIASLADRNKLSELDKALAESAPRKALLEKQLRGEYPWQRDDVTRFATGGTPVTSAKVTVVTSFHEGADTRNFVYFRTGPYKFLIGSPDAPLTGQAGPQNFSLDVVGAAPMGVVPQSPMAAPSVPLQLTMDVSATAVYKENLRSWALGLLGSPFPQGPVPDRWHPQRLIVEIDGQVVYDSDPVDLDRRSLDAIRLIPPRHLDWENKTILNNPIEREAYVWEAGKGAGIDPDTQLPEPLPAVTDRRFPAREADVTVAAQALHGFPLAPRKDEQPIIAEPAAILGQAAPFPGEDVPPLLPPSPEMLPPPTIVVLPVAVFVQDGLEARPAGDQFEIDALQIMRGRRNRENFHIQWSVKPGSDPSQISHYVVKLIEIRPTSNTPKVGGLEYPNTPVIVPAGVTEASIFLDIANVDSLWLAPRVIPVPLDPTKQPRPGEKIGPAIPILRAESEGVPVLRPGRLYDVWGKGETPPSAAPLGLTQKRKLFPGQHAFSAMGPLKTHIDLTVGQNPLAPHLGVVPDKGGGARVFVHARDAAFPSNVKLRLIAHLGFADVGPSKVDLTVNCYRGPATPYQPLAGIPASDRTFKLDGEKDNLLLIDIGPLPAVFPGEWYGFSFDFANFTGPESAHPVLYGLRLVPVR